MQNFIITGRKKDASRQQGKFILSKVKQKLSLEFSPPMAKSDSLHRRGAAPWCREPYSGAISPRVSAE